MGSRSLQTIASQLGSFQLWHALPKRHAAQPERCAWQGSQLVQTAPECISGEASCALTTTAVRAVLLVFMGGGGPSGVATSM